MSNSQHQRPSQRNWWTNRKVICIALLLLAAGYVYAQPTLERWLGMDLPNLVERDEDKERDESKKGVGSSGEFRIDPAAIGKNESSGKKDSSKPGTTGKATRSATFDAGGDFPLQKTGRDSYRSPEGLVYTKGPREHRIEHVMLHTQDDKGRPVHGVFDAKSKEDVLALLDEAYKMVKEKSRNVSESASDGKTELTIDMPKRIGFVGGASGARQNRPSTKRLKLVLIEDRVITAYPTWPPRGRR